MIEIKKINVKGTYPIRKEVLRKNIDLPYTFSGDLDKDTYHFGLYLDNQLIGVVSFMKYAFAELSGKQYQLRGMATLQDFQGKGYGNMLIVFGLKILAEKQIEVVWCNARVTALNFYKNAGFHIIGEQFNIPKIGGHYVMYKNL